MLISTGVRAVSLVKKISTVKLLAGPVTVACTRSASTGLPPSCDGLRAHPIQAHFINAPQNHRLPRRQTALSQFITSELQERERIAGASRHILVARAAAGSLRLPRDGVRVLMEGVRLAAFVRTAMDGLVQFHGTHIVAFGSRMVFVRDRKARDARIDLKIRTPSHRGIRSAPSRV